MRRARKKRYLARSKERKQEVLNRADGISPIASDIKLVELKHNANRLRRKGGRGV